MKNLKFLLWLTFIVVMLTKCIRCQDTSTTLESNLKKETFIQVHVWSLDGSSLINQNVVLRFGEKYQIVSLRDSSYGVVKLAIPYSYLTKNILLYIDAEKDENRRFHPSLLVEGLISSHHIKAVLVPLSFNISFGHYKGKSVEVSIRNAITPKISHLPSFYRSSTRINGIPNDALPIKVGICTNGVLESDGEAVWTALQDFAYCVWPQGQLYKRVSFESLDSKEGLKISFNPSGSFTLTPYLVVQSLSGIDQIIHSYGGKITHISFPSKFPDSDTYARSFAGSIHWIAMQTIGFGSLGNWPSVVSSFSFGRVTVYDVAYIRMMQLAYDLAIKYQIPPRNIFYAAVEGEKIKIKTKSPV